MRRECNGANFTEMATGSWGRFYPPRRRARQPSLDLLGRVYSACWIGCAASCTASSIEPRLLAFRARRHPRARSPSAKRKQLRKSAHFRV